MWAHHPRDFFRSLGLVSRVMEVIGRDGVEEHRVILVIWLSVPHRVIRMSAE